MARDDRFGTQPFLALMRDEGRTVAGVARKLGVTYGQLYTVARGWIVPSPEMRQALSDLLGESEDALFTPDALRTAPSTAGRKA